MARDYWSKLSTSVRKRLGRPHSMAELDPALSAKPVLFCAPQLTPQLIEAIKLISPQFRLRADEHSRNFWQLNQNGLSWGEYEALEPYLGQLPESPKVLDIGPGLGRSAVFFSKVMRWQGATLHLYESTGDSTRYTKAGPRFDDSFCGNLDALETLLKYNEIDNYRIFDGAELNASLAELPGPYDFIYSFFAIGFHWSIEHFLAELLDLMQDHSVAAFTLHPRFGDYQVFEHLPHRLVEFQRSWPRGRRTEMLVLAKTEQALATS